jgi:hypothetical protein
MRTSSEYVARSKWLLDEAGGRTLNGIRLQPETNAALHRLLTLGYAESVTKVVARAIREASEAQPLAPGC